MKLLATNTFRFFFTTVLGLIVGLSARSCDRMPPEIPALSQRSEYEKLFAAIDRAEAENDPIKRCLIYPSPPHLNWSPTLIEALCRDKFTGGSFAAELKPMIDAREWNKLDAHFAEYLERHYSGEDPEYRLYRAFPLISWESGSDADRYTLRWVKGAPDSPYANTARAKILMSRAWKIRGDGFTKDIQPQRMRRANDLTQQASVLLNRAINQEPRLLPAYDLLLDAYAFNGQTGMRKRALKAALRQSPTSYYVRASAAHYMRQAWGGTLDEVDALVEEARPQFARNPRLAMLVQYRDNEKGRVFDIQERYRRALPPLRAALRSGPSFEALIRAERSASNLGYHVEGLMYLSQNIRFERAPADYLLRRAGLWEWDGNFTRALRDVRAAAKMYPHNQIIAKRLAELERSARAAREKKN
jgi:tetratricopeptide (TPR) repeat protein